MSRPRPATGEAGEAFPSSSALQRTLKAQIGGVDPTSYEGRSRSAGEIFFHKFSWLFFRGSYNGIFTNPKNKG